MTRYFKDAVFRCAGLAYAEDVAGAAQAEIGFGDCKSIFCAAERIETFAGGFAEWGR